ncbi:MAG: energy-coupling factor ABC transporter ATP-binding protein [Candidatus Helarchaeota archaeon]
MSLKIEDGELLGLMGENGAGKTTLVKLFTGLLRPTKGEIFVNNKNIITLSIAEIAHIIGFVFQNSDHQIFSKNVTEEIGFILKNFGYDEARIKNQTLKVLQKFNLEQYKDQSPFLLSGGERKRVALASILCAEPQIIILDEPTIGQDAYEKQKLMTLIQDLKANGVTIIIITHDIEFTAEYLPRCVLLSKGEIIADGPTEFILANELIVKEASLIEPQIAQLSELLKLEKKIFTLEEMEVKILEILRGGH